MSAIPAASVNLKTMADGTLRVSFDIDPKDAQDAFRLFAAPGTPVAIAALKTGYAAVAEPDPPKEPVGPLCQWLVMRCREPEFWQWLNEKMAYDVADEEDAKKAVCHTLDVNSRKEVDRSVEVTNAFHAYIRIPYQNWLAKGKK